MFVTRVLLGFAVVAGAFGLVLTAIEVLQRGTVAREIALGAKRGYGDAIRAAEGAWVRFGYNGSVGIDEPGWGTALVCALPAFLFGAAMIVAAWKVFRVVVDVQVGVPFGPQAVRRLRTAAAAVAVATVLHPLASALADSVVFRAAVVGETSGPPLEIARRLLDASPWFLVAALLAAFAQAFSEGQRLADDNQGLV